MRWINDRPLIAPAVGIAAILSGVVAANIADALGSQHLLEWGLGGSIIGMLGMLYHATRA
jgi:hypothetical protein